MAFFFMLVVGFCFSQTPAAVGTYQLMTTNVKYGEVFNTDILPMIESNRKINRVVILKIGDYTWVKILSENTINNPNFVPLPEEIIEIKQSDIVALKIENNETN